MLHQIWLCISVPFFFLSSPILAFTFFFHELSSLSLILPSVTDSCSASRPIHLSTSFITINIAHCSDRKYVYCCHSLIGHLFNVFSLSLPPPLTLGICVHCKEPVYCEEIKHVFNDNGLMCGWMVGDWNTTACWKIRSQHLQGTSIMGSQKECLRASAVVNSPFVSQGPAISAIVPLFREGIGFFFFFLFGGSPCVGGWLPSLTNGQT